MSVLANCSIRFHTNDDDKDAETLVNVNVIDASDVVAAHVSNFFGHFPENSDDGPFQLQLVNPSSRESLQNGRLNLEISTDVLVDTWHFNFLLDLLFDDGSHLSGGANGLSLSTENRLASFSLAELVHTN